MFVELHRLDGTAITINLDKIEYFVSTDDEKHTAICVPNYNGWLRVEEAYDQVKETIVECQKK